jgi:hypothetical protein
MGQVREYQILNFGAGVQSTTLYLMAMAAAGKLPSGATDLPMAPQMDGSFAFDPASVGVPWFDAAIFADTGEEPAAVYEHLKWCQSLGGPPIIVRSAGRLGEDLMRGRNTTGQRFAAIPAYTTDGSDGEPGRTRRQCSKEYKTEVIERAIRRDVLGLQPRQRIPKGVKIWQYFGISWDERSRASRIWERFHVTEESKYEPVFPLVDRQWTRANCLDWLRGRVPHEVPRSACVFCPFHDDREWLRIKQDDPESWARAVEVDTALRTEGSVVNRDMRQTMYLHRKCLPLTQIEFRPRSNPKELQLGFGMECEGVCGV